MPTDAPDLEQAARVLALVAGTIARPGRSFSGSALRADLRDLAEAIARLTAADLADDVRHLTAQRDALRKTAEQPPQPEQAETGTEGHPAESNPAQSRTAPDHVCAWPNPTRSCTCGARPPDHRPRVVPPHPAITELFGITADDLARFTPTGIETNAVTAERAEDVLPPPDPRTFPGLEQEWSRPL